MWHLRLYVVVERKDGLTASSGCCAARAADRASIQTISRRGGKVDPLTAEALIPYPAG